MPYVCTMTKVPPKTVFKKNISSSAFCAMLFYTGFYLYSLSYLKAFQSFFLLILFWLLLSNIFIIRKISKDDFFGT